MKKTYIIPELEVVKVQTQQMLAASTMTIGIVSDPNIDDPNDVLAPEMDLDDYFDGGADLDKFFE